MLRIDTHIVTRNMPKPSPRLLLLALAVCATMHAAPPAIAHTDFRAAGMPQAHFWEELPGYRSAKPQATVAELLAPQPLAVSIDQLQEMKQWDQSDAYQLLTDEQQARQDAERETAASRIGESNWHYGWGVGFDDIKFRLSYDF